MYKKLVFETNKYDSEAALTNVIMDALKEFSDYFTVEAVTNIGYADATNPSIKFTPAADTGYYFTYKFRRTTTFTYHEFYNAGSTARAAGWYNNTNCLTFMEIFTNEDSKEFFIIINGTEYPCGVFKAQNGEYVFYTTESIYKNGTRYTVGRMLIDNLIVPNGNSCFLINNIPSWGGQPCYYPLENVYMGIMPTSMYRGAKCTVNGNHYVGIAHNGNESGLKAYQGCLFRYTMPEE